MSMRQGLSTFALIALIGAISAALFTVGLGSVNPDDESPDLGVYQRSPAQASATLDMANGDGGPPATTGEEMADDEPTLPLRPPFLGKWGMGIGYQHAQLIRHYSDYFTVSGFVRNDEFTFGADFLIGRKQVFLPPVPAVQPTPGGLQTAVAFDVNLTYTLYSSTLTRPFLSLREGVEITPDLALRSTFAFGLSAIIPRVADTEVFVGYQNTTNFSQAAHAFLLGTRITFGTVPPPAAEHNSAQIAMTRHLDDAIRKYGNGFKRLQNAAFMNFIDGGDYQKRNYAIEYPYCYVAMAVSEENLGFGTPAHIRLELTNGNGKLLDADEGSAHSPFPLFDSYCPPRPKAGEANPVLNVAISNKSTFGNWAAAVLLRREFAGSTPTDDNASARFAPFEQERVAALAATKAAGKPTAPAKTTTAKMGQVFVVADTVPPGKCHTAIGAAVPDADLDSFSFVRRTRGTAAWWELVDSDTKPFPDAGTVVCNISASASITVDTLYSIMADASEDPAADRSTPVLTAVYERDVDGLRGVRVSGDIPPSPAGATATAYETWIVSPSLGDFSNSSFGVPLFTDAQKELTVSADLPPDYGDPMELLQLNHLTDEQSVGTMHGSVLHEILAPHIFYYLYMPMERYRSRTPFVLHFQQNADPLGIRTLPSPP